MTFPELGPEIYLTEQVLRSVRGSVALSAAAVAVVYDPGRVSRSPWHRLVPHALGRAPGALPARQHSP